VAGWRIGEAGAGARRRWLRHGRWVVALGAVFATWLTTAQVASAVSTYDFVGTVTDQLGSPLAGAYVSDGGGQVTTTNAQGRYVLGETSPGTFDLVASRPGMAQEEVTYTVTVPTGDYTQNFSLLYVIGGTMANPYLSAASGPASTVVSIRNWAPANPSCVEVTDSRTGLTGQAAYTSTNSDGTSNWSYTFDVPQGAAEGSYSLSVIADDCSSGRPLTVPGSVPYLVDNTPPAISSPAPTAYTNRTAPLISFKAQDNSSGVDPRTATLSLDGATEPLTATPDGPAEIFSYSVPTSARLGVGSHVVKAAVSDQAGNTTTYSWTFEVDTTPPTISTPSPTGTISTRTPLLSASVADPVSGIDPSSITMTVSDGLMSHALTPTYDPASGEVTYQVPTIPSGAGVGQFPLVDGTYTVKLTVGDNAGNVSLMAWTFTVQTLPG
jgi:hypothetical protein